NPSRSSLYAAANPADTNFLFFVANGKGGHAFASTHKQHQRNVRRWLRGQ
ncbi:MAG: endolytic transglycosylase MltG, partial [Mariprofundaceae bacterium]|nr:endolytic transglycosylase MltG [Mariprofundaceae bacterium]